MQKENHWKLSIQEPGEDAWAVEVSGMGSFVLRSIGEFGLIDKVQKIHPFLEDSDVITSCYVSDELREFHGKYLTIMQIHN